MMLYLPYLDKRFLVLPNEYAIEFKTNEKYKYSCRNNFENIFLKILNSSRKFSDFRQYILSFDNSCEWEYSYETLYKTNEDKLIKILTEKENKLNKINFCENLEKYYNKLNNEKCSMSEINIDLISNLNFKLKINNLNIIYTLLLYFKEFIVISGGKCLNLNVETIFSNEILINFLGKQILKKIQNHIYKYNWFLDRIENLCDYLNINFSSRETTNIDMKIFAKKYKTLYNSNLRKDYICFEKFKETAKLIIVRMMKEYEK